jgi:polar amino acid transport system substrate-binding protein
MKKESVVIAIIAVIALVISLVAFSSKSNNSKTNVASNSSVYDNVIKNGEIKVGYVVYPPGLIKDPNTGQLSGIFYDTLQEAGKNLGVKINWSEEASWGTMIEGLEAGKFDVIGSPVWATTARGAKADFSVPLMYSAVGVYTRANDSRFDNSLDAINSANVKISTIDGEMAETIAKQDFPQAQRIGLPQMAQVSEMLLNVAQGKADVAFVENPTAIEYSQQNPGKIKNVATKTPIRLWKNSMMYKKGEYKFGSMLDTALQELIDNGFVNKLLKKYTGGLDSLYPVAKPFTSPL